jgi:hypothetical protein
MAALSIHDLVGQGLAFDLPELLQALGPQGASAWWRPKTKITYISRDDLPIQALEPHDRGGPWTVGRSLLELDGELRQIIDGVLESVQGEPRAVGDSIQPWVTLRAVDSSWWEVYTDDPMVMAEMRQRFKDIRPAHYTPDYPATNY